MLDRVVAKIRKITYFTVPIALGIMFFIAQVQAATMSLGASTSQAKVGELVTVRLFTNTESKTINNAEATLLFDENLVEAISFSTRNSIFSLWVEQPNFSNDSGRLTFNGGLPNPGYAGGNGEILTVTFRAKAVGTASFSVAGGAIRENDGLGTDVLTSQGSVSINITANATTQEPPTDQNQPTTPVENPTNNTGLGSAPIVSSATYPDQNDWYSQKAGLITWQLPTGSVAVQTLLGYYPNSTPSVTYRPSIYQKQISNLKDGVWYFHLRYQKNGKWSDIAHYRIQIDSEAPTDLTVEPIQSETGISLKLSAQDSRSGVDYYQIIVGDQPPLKVSAQEAAAPIKVVGLGFGENQVTVEAYDKADNKAVANLPIIVNPSVAPIIDTYPEKIGLGDTMTISGSSIYAQSKIKINIKSATGELMSFDALTDIQGKFSFTSTPLNTAANYQVWAYLINDQGQMTPESAKVNVLVEAAEDIEAAGQTATGKILSEKIQISFALSLKTILLIITSLLLAIILFYGWYSVFVLRKKLRELENKSNQTFNLLINKANKQTVILNKYNNKYTKEEK